MSAVLTHPSPNFGERAEGKAIRFIVVHYTGMRSKEEALARLVDPAAQVSAHYLIDEMGEVLSLVDEAKRAWHAGKSFWRGECDLNSVSIGIELVNRGHEFGYEPFRPQQIAALIELCHAIVARHGLDPVRCLLAHSDVAPDRKQDPGEFFPWEQLAQEGLGFWPEPRPEDYVPLTFDRAAMLLGIVGYGGALVPALVAFQRRYCPDHVDGVLEAETSACLRDVARRGT